MIRLLLVMIVNTARLITSKFLIKSFENMNFFRPGAYDLFKHNCNNFSDEVSQFLCGQGIPKSILQLPDEVLNT